MQILQLKSGISKQDSVYKHCKVSIGYPPLIVFIKKVIATHAEMLIPDMFMRMFTITQLGNLEKVF